MVGGGGSAEAGGLPQPQLCLQDRDEGSEKMDHLFHIFCDLLVSKPCFLPKSQVWDRKLAH